jgi:hypothetical protein
MNEQTGLATLIDAMPGSCAMPIFDAHVRMEMRQAQFPEMWEAMRKQSDQQVKAFIHFAVIHFSDSDLSLECSGYGAK